MWQTPGGERVISGAERALVVESAADLADLFDLDDEDTGGWPTGVDVFDRLPVPTRVVLLADVMRALTDESIPAPELLACNEAAVYVIFRHVADTISTWINLEQAEGLSPGEVSGWRQLVLAAWLEIAGPEEGEEPPEADDAAEWDNLVECLADAILWDRDFEEVDIVDDLPAKQALEVLEQARIGVDYFSVRPPKPDRDAVERAVEFLYKLDQTEQG
jgi:hypothetical protein